MTDRRERGTFSEDADAVTDDLPPDWKTAWSTRYNTQYFYNTKTGQRQWKRPKATDVKSQKIARPPSKSMQESHFNSPPKVAHVQVTPKRNTSSDSMLGSRNSQTTKKRSGKDSSKSEQRTPPKVSISNAATCSYTKADTESVKPHSGKLLCPQNAFKQPKSELQKINSLSNRIFKQRKERNGANSSVSGDKTLITSSYTSMYLGKNTQSPSECSNPSSLHSAAAPGKAESKVKHKSKKRKPYQKSQSKPKLDDQIFPAVKRSGSAPVSSTSEVKDIKTFSKPPGAVASGNENEIMCSVTSAVASGASNMFSASSVVLGAVTVSKAGASLCSSVTLPVTRDSSSSDVDMSSSLCCDDNSISVSHSAVKYEEEEDMDTTEELHSAIQHVRSQQSKLPLSKKNGDLTRTFLASNKACSDRNHEIVFFIVDTNMFLAELGQITELVSLFNNNRGRQPVVVLPWVVMQELDALKQEKHSRSEMCAAKARKAVLFLNKMLEHGNNAVRGQSPTEAEQASREFTAECNDDKILQCCLQYKRQNPCSQILLLTLDTQLRSKAVISGIKVPPRKHNLRKFFETSSAHLPIQNGATHTSVRHAATDTPVQHRVTHTPVQHRVTHTPVQHGEAWCQSVYDEWAKEQAKCNELAEVLEKDMEKELCDLVKNAITEVIQTTLGSCLEKEMKAEYEALWLDIVYIKPPWSPEQILLSIKKHWMAVFGDVFGRSNEDILKSVVKNYQRHKSSPSLQIQCGILEKLKKLCTAINKEQKHQATDGGSYPYVTDLLSRAFDFPYSLHCSSVRAVFQKTWNAIIAYGKEFGEIFMTGEVLTQDVFSSFVKFLLSVNDIHVHYQRLMATDADRTSTQDELLNNLCCSLWCFAKQSKNQNLTSMHLHYLRSVFNHPDDIELLKNGLAQLESMMNALSELKCHLSEEHLLYVQNSLDQRRLV